MMRNRVFITVAAALLLAACTSNPKSVVDSAPVPYAVPVAAGCVAEGGKPEAPKPLRDHYPDEQWTAMPPGAKAQAVAAQGGHRLNYEDRFAASTAGCK